MTGVSNVVEERTTVPTHDKLSETAGLVPASFPYALHALEGDETLPCPFWTGACSTLHGGKQDIGLDRRVPIAKPYGAKRAVTENFKLRVRPLRTWVSVSVCRYCTTAQAGGHQRGRVTHMDLLRQHGHRPLLAYR